MNMMQLSPNLHVGGQIAAEDLATLAREGFTDVVCNRPDAEHPEDPCARTLADLAARHGLNFHYLPITHGEAPLAQAGSLARVTAQPGAKVFAYCRSGARSSAAWALAQEARVPAQGARN